MVAELYDLSTETAPAERRPLFGDERALVRVAFAIGAVMTLWRLFMIFNTNLMWDEAHFWMSGEHPALGYPDIPAGFPLIARLLTSVAWSLLPLRLFSLALSIAMPFAIWFMARPVAGERNAIWAAIISMLVPAVALNGTLFYPEGAVQILLALMCGCLVRAVSGNAMKWWLWTGACAAAGLFIHFRFLVPGAGVLLWLLATAEGRGQWRRPGLYVAAGLALAGLLPSLIYNAMHSWPAVAFHAGRQAFAFHPAFVVSFLTIQIGMMTPVFLLAAIAAAVRAVRGGEGRLVAIVAATLLIFYVGLALIDKHVMPHWAWLAIVPTLALVPGELERFTASGSRLRQGLVALGPVLGVLAGLGVSMVGYVTAHADAVSWQMRQAAADTNEDWSRVLPLVAEADAEARARYGSAMWGASGHRAASRLEVLGRRGHAVYSLDEPYDVLSRFTIERAEWKLGSGNLAGQAGKGVVLVLDEPPALYHDRDATAFYERLCHSFGDIRESGATDLPPGRVRVHVYTARVQPSSGAVSPLTCPLLPAIYIAKPAPGEFVATSDRVFHGFGMAADAQGFKTLELLVDGKPRATEPVRYGLDVLGSPAPSVLSYDPHYPDVQFDFSMGYVAPGRHILSIRATRADGSQVESPGQTIYVK